MIRVARDTISNMLRPCIWIIEDDNICARLIMRKIQKLGNVRIIHITTAKDFMERLNRLDAGIGIVPRVAIIDRNLPCIGGEEIGVLLKKCCPSTKTALYSGDIDGTLVDYEKKAFKFDAMIKKGKSNDGLTSFVSSCLQAS